MTIISVESFNRRERIKPAYETIITKSLAQIKWSPYYKRVSNSQDFMRLFKITPYTFQAKKGKTALHKLAKYILLNKINLSPVDKMRLINDVFNEITDSFSNDVAIYNKIHIYKEQLETAQKQLETVQNRTNYSRVLCQCKANVISAEQNLENAGSLVKFLEQKDRKGRTFVDYWKYSDKLVALQISSFEKEPSKAKLDLNYR